MQLIKKLSFYISLAAVMAMALGISLYMTRISANPSPTEWIVDPRGPPYGTHSSINDAITDASDGDVIWVRNSTYYEHIVVNKSVTIKWDYVTYDPELPPHRPIVDGSGSGVVFNVTASNVQIFNLTIQNAGEGIYLFPTAVDASIIRNFVKSNTYNGIYVDSVNNTIKCNTLTYNNNFGMYIDSSGNFLRDNIMTNNTYNFGISNFINNDIDPSNTINGKPIYIWIDQHYRQVPHDAGYVTVVNSTNIIVEDLKLSNNDCGVRFINTSDSTIANVEASYNLNGLYLLNAENITVENVNAQHNFAYGIMLDASNSTRIVHNIVSGEGTGIGLWDSRDNTVIENTIQNHIFGIEDVRGANNCFYHNNIKNNTNQVLLEEEYELCWDNNKEGNYWSDYEDKYPHVVDADGDGIWDHPYEINPHNFDRYPLVQPWKSIRLFNVAKTVPHGTFKGYILAVHCDHVIASLNFTIIGEEIYPRLFSFNITAGSPGFCNTTIPRAWLDGPFMLWIDDVPKSFQITQNASHSSLYFTYTTGKYQVKIVGVKPGTVLGDLNGDGKIDMRDIRPVAAKFGERLPSNLTPEDVTEYDP